MSETALRSRPVSPPIGSMDTPATTNCNSEQTMTVNPDTTTSCDETRADCLLDTVGAVCIDAYGRMSSAVSSGGIVLKQSGRLGQVYHIVALSNLLGKPVHQ